YKASLDEIKTDNQLIAEAKSDANKELLAQYPAANYTTNVNGFNDGPAYNNITAYETAISTFNAALEAVVKGEEMTASQAIVAVDEALQSALQTISSVPTNSDLLSQIRTDASSVVSNYRASDINDIAEALKTEISNYKQGVCTDISTSAATAIHAKVNAAKTQIDAKIASADKNLQQLQEEEIAAIDVIVIADNRFDTTDDAEYYTVAQGIIDDAKDAVNAITDESEKGNVTGIADEAEARVTLWKEIYQARKDLIAYAEGVKEDVASDTYKGQIDSVISAVPTMLTLANIADNEALEESVNSAYEVINTAAAKDALVSSLTEYADVIKADMKNSTYEGKVDEALTDAITAIFNAGANQLDQVEEDAYASIDALQDELEGQSFTVTWKETDGSVIDTTDSVPYNTPVELLRPLAKDDDHRFIGWYLDKQFETEFTAETEVCDNMTVYAKWEEKDFTVYYKDGDKTLFTAKYFTTNPDGSAITSGLTQPVDEPYKSGKLFDNWYVSNEDGADTFDFDNYLFLEGSTSVNVYAKFRDKEINELTDKATWTSPDVTANATVENNTIANNLLFKVTTTDAKATYTAKGFQSPTSSDTKNKVGDSKDITIGGKTLNNVLYTGNVTSGNNNSDRPIVITLKENLSALTVYAKVTDSKGTTNRKGYIYCVINGVQYELASNDDTKTELGGKLEIHTLKDKTGKLISLKASDVIEIYYNPTNSGSAMLFGEINATIDASDIEGDLTVNYYVDETEGAEPAITEKFHSFLSEMKLTSKPISNGDLVFEYWYSKDSEGHEIKYGEGEGFVAFPTNLEGTTELKVYAHWGVAADLIINYYNEDGTQLVETHKQYSTDAVSYIPADLEDTADGEFDGWYIFTDDGEGNKVKGDKVTTSTTLEAGTYEVRYVYNYYDLTVVIVNGTERNTHKQFADKVVTGIPATDPANTETAKFVGWYIGSENAVGETPFDPEKKDYESGITLYIHAKFVEYDLIITYYLDSEATEALGTVKFVKSLDTVTIAAPKKSGFKFVNWVNKANDSVIADLSNLEGTANEIYADWEASSSETFSAADLTIGAEVTKNNLIYTGDLFTLGIDNGGKVVEHSASTEDNSVSFNQLIVGGGNRTFKVTAKQAIKIKVYYVIAKADSNYSLSSSTSNRNPVVGSTAIDGAYSGKYDLNTAYTFEVTLEKDEEYGFKASGDRLFLYSIVAEQV
ncbi:MAG: InlB B-repeat-containing protein, partial [Clostridia bacterium]|nr:InlB B-repeat-containing protein [Clostridia bacterium]